MGGAPTPRSTTTESPLCPLRISSAILYDSGIIARNRSNRSLRKLNSMYLYLPHRKRSIFARCPSRSHIATLDALICMSRSEVPIFTCVTFVSVTCGFSLSPLFLFFFFFFFFFLLFRKCPGLDLFRERKIKEQKKKKEKEGKGKGACHRDESDTGKDWHL